MGVNENELKVGDRVKILRSDIVSPFSIFVRRLTGLPVFGRITRIDDDYVYVRHQEHVIELYRNEVAKSITDKD